MLPGVRVAPFDFIRSTTRAADRRMLEFISGVALGILTTDRSHTIYISSAFRPA